MDGVSLLSLTSCCSHSLIFSASSSRLVRFWRSKVWCGSGRVRAFIALRPLAPKASLHWGKLTCSGQAPRTRWVRLRRAVRRWCECGSLAHEFFDVA